MKKFRKTGEGFFICEECGLLCKAKFRLCIHINKKHNNKVYHDKWIKEDIDGLCKICNKETGFIDVGQGYKNCCCKQHGWDWNHIQINKVVKEKYGIHNISQLKEVKDKKKQTKKDRYKNENYNNAEKRKKTCFKKYGVDSPMKTKNIFEKSQKNSYYSKKYKNTNIYYRGSYELDFLDKYYDKYPDICNAPSIKYIFKEKHHYYFPDFYIPSLNLIIECKNSYLLKKDARIIKEKEKATIANGFNYILILNKKYLF